MRSVRLGCEQSPHQARDLVFPVHLFEYIGAPPCDPGQGLADGECRQFATVRNARTRHGTPVEALGPPMRPPRPDLGSAGRGRGRFAGGASGLLVRDYKGKADRLVKPKGRVGPAGNRNRREGGRIGRSNVPSLNRLRAMVSLPKYSRKCRGLRPATADRWRDRVLTSQPFSRSRRVYRSQSFNSGSGPYQE